MPFKAAGIFRRFRISKKSKNLEILKIKGPRKACFSEFLNFSAFFKILKILKIPKKKHAFLGPLILRILNFFCIFGNLKISKTPGVPLRLSDAFIF